MFRMATSGRGWPLTAQPVCPHHTVMKREIWFEKVLWSYMPCHWKGWAILFAIALLTVIAIMLTQKALAAFGHSDADWLPWVIFFLPALVSLMAIAKRHS